MPKVTVLMSVYNSELFLREAIESILDQTLDDFEFLIVDDCSNDSSAEILRSYSDPRICLVTNERNIGLTKSLNKGLALAKGKYIARMDADDISLPRRLEQQVAFLEARLECSLVAGLYETIDENGTIIKSTNGWQPNPERLYIDLTFGNCFPHAAVTFRAEAAIKTGGYDEQFRRSQDMDMWFRLSRDNAVCVLPEVLIQYRDTKGNISNFYQSEQMECARRIFVSNLKYLLGKDASTDDLMCFEDQAIKYKLPVTVTGNSLTAFRMLAKKMAINAPAALDKDEILRQANIRLREMSIYLVRKRWQMIFDGKLFIALLDKLCRALIKRLYNFNLKFWSKPVR